MLKLFVLSVPLSWNGKPTNGLLLIKIKEKLRKKNIFLYVFPDV